MPKGFRRVPHPAILVEAAADDLPGTPVSWSCTPACSRRANAVAWVPTQWQLLVLAIQQMPSQGEDEGWIAELGTCWWAMELQEGQVDWLADQAPDDRSPPAQQPAGSTTRQLHHGQIPPLQVAMASGLLGLGFWRLSFADHRIRANAWSFGPAHRRGFRWTAPGRINAM